MKKKKETYIAVICPVCEWKTIGNWGRMQIIEYQTHYLKTHFPKPYIKEEKR